LSGNFLGFLNLLPSTQCSHAHWIEMFKAERLYQCFHQYLIQAIDWGGIPRKYWVFAGRRGFLVKYVLLTLFCKTRKAGWTWNVSGIEFVPKMPNFSKNCSNFDWTQLTFRSRNFTKTYCGSRNFGARD